MTISGIEEILTHKRCGILLVTSCLIYFILNLVFLQQKMVTAISGAVSSMIGFAIFLYFIIIVYREKEKQNAK